MEKKKIEKFEGNPALALIITFLCHIIISLIISIAAILVFGVLNAIFQGITEPAIALTLIATGFASFFAQLFISIFISFDVLGSVYGNAKTSTFKIYSLALCIIALALGLISFFVVIGNDTQYSTITNGINAFTFDHIIKLIFGSPDDAIILSNAQLCFFTVALLFLTVGSIIDFRKKACPKCKRANMMGNYKVTGISNRKTEARFNETKGHWTTGNASFYDGRSANPTTVTYDTYVPGSSTFKGVYHSYNESGTCTCRRCGHRKSRYSTVEKKIL